MRYKLKRADTAPQLLCRKKSDVKYEPSKYSYNGISCTEFLGARGGIADEKDMIENDKWASKENNVEFIPYQKDESSGLYYKIIKDSSRNVLTIIHKNTKLFVFSESNTDLFDKLSKQFLQNAIYNVLNNRDLYFTTKSQPVTIFSISEPTENDNLRDGYKLAIPIAVYENGIYSNVPAFIPNSRSPEEIRKMNLFPKSLLSTYQNKRRLSLVKNGLVEDDYVGIAGTKYVGMSDWQTLSAVIYGDNTTPIVVDNRILNGDMKKISQPNQNYQ